MKRADQKFIHKKSLGQHFLTSTVVPSWMVAAAEVGKNDLILEIGPGTGVLTKALLAAGAKVIALEADQRAIEVLNNTFNRELSTSQLTVFHTDVRTLDLKTLGLIDHKFKVVANIPYYLSGFLFRTMLESDIQPSDLIFLVQKEVAKRASDSVEKGGKSSLLSLSIQVYGDVTYVKTVSRGHFNPPPQVDSAVIAIKNVNRNSFSNKEEEKAFFTLIHTGFGQKRKQLQHNLKNIIESDKVTEVLADLNLSPTVRAEDLNLTNWLNLTKKLKGTV